MHHLRWDGINYQVLVSPPLWRLFNGHCGPQRIKDTSGHWLHLSNCLHLKRLSHWSCKFDFSPLCGLNVSSSRLYKRKQSRTGCICMTCMGWDKLSVIGVSTDHPSPIWPSIVPLSTRVAILNGGLTKLSIWYRAHCVFRSSEEEPISSNMIYTTIQNLWLAFSLQKISCDFPDVSLVY